MKLTRLSYILFITVLALADSKERPLIYSPVGKRDPFRAPTPNVITRDPTALSPIEKYSMEQLQLRGVLRGGGKNRAMFEDPEGKTHILFEGEYLGREKATISRILNTGVIVTKKTVNYLGAEAITEEVISLPDEEMDSFGKRKSP